MSRIRFPVARALVVLAALAARASAAPPAVAAGGGSLAVEPGGAAPVRACETLATLKLPDTTISLAQTVSSVAFTPPGGKPLTGLPAFCRVAGVVRPSADSQIELEVWMPAAGWNGKLHGE